MNLSPLFTGARVRLGAFSPEDAQAFSRWYQDSEFTRHLDAAPAIPKSESRLARWLEDEERSRDSYVFAIRTLDTDLIVGFVHIDGIQWNHGVAWLAIGIGEPDYRGRSIGYEAMQLAMQFAFHEINLHRLQLTVFSYNARAIRLYEKLGFRKEGVFREALNRDGQRYHMFLYGILRREWEDSLSSTS
ncbi:MAG: GNAT family N-acetyltransferase [Anaerolineae bacterium]|nr:GNAT family N-acetyltransferase [Anaerolineae bacterium]